MPNFLHEVGVNAGSPLFNQASKRVRGVSGAPQPAECKSVLIHNHHFIYPSLKFWKYISVTHETNLIF